MRYVLSHYLLVIFYLCSCQEVSKKTDDPPPLNETICGESLDPSSQEVSLHYGFDRPFIPSPYNGTESEPLELKMEYGLQGGHHVDLSLRFTGAFDPDLVDINIDLQVNGSLHDLYHGVHNTLDWYLLYPQDSEEEGCYFHKARIFLFDQNLEPLDAIGVESLSGNTVQLFITLITSDTTIYEWHAHGILFDATAQQ